MTSVELTHLLLFVIGVLSGLIAGYFLTRKYARSSASGGSSERLLQQQLAKADDGLKRFSDELESQKKELKEVQNTAQESARKAAVAETELQAVTKQRDELRANSEILSNTIEEIRSKKEELGREVGESGEKLNAVLEEKKRLEGDQLEFKANIDKLTNLIDSVRKQKEQLSREVGEAAEKLKAAEEESLRLVNEQNEIKTILKTTNAERDSIRDRREELSATVSSLQEQINSQQEDISRLENEREDLKSQQLKVIQERDDLREDREQLSNQIAEVNEQLRSQEVQTQFLEKARSELLTQFKALSAKMLEGSRDALLKSTKETVSDPFSKEVEKLRKQVETLTKDSTEKLGALAQTTKDLRQRSEDVQGAAQQLTSALRSPNVKGQWGEMNLKRILEFVGLIGYCDFDEQVHVDTETGSYRPDCVITIPGERKLVIDSKAPIESYLDALQSPDVSSREKALDIHLKKVRSHIDQLSKKEYAKKLGSLGQVVDAVVLFIPVEGALSMALERDPGLLEYAISKNIILTFPTSLLAILKGLAMNIQQAQLAQNIDEIQKNAVELYKRYALFTDKFNAVGANISKLNKSFNEAVGSYERRLMPQGRKFAELAGQNVDQQLTEGIDEEVREIKPES